MKVSIQHEFDYEPTYIVFKRTDEELVEFSPKISWKLRLKLAKMVKKELEKAKE